MDCHKVAEKIRAYVKDCVRGDALDREYLLEIADEIDRENTHSDDASEYYVPNEDDAREHPES